MSESELQRRGRVALRKAYPGIKIFKFSDRFISGRLDWLLLWQGRYVWIELKMAPNQSTKLQRYEADQIRAAGGKAFFCFSIEEILEAAKCLLEKQ